MADIQFFAALEAAKGSPATTKVCKSGSSAKPAMMTIGFGDGTSVSFPRRDAQALTTDAELAAFVARILG